MGTVNNAVCGIIDNHHHNAQVLFVLWSPVPAHSLEHCLMLNAPVGHHILGQRALHSAVNA